MTKTYHMQDTIACDSITLTPTGAYLYSEEEFAEAFGPEAGEVLTALKEWILAEGMEFELLLHRRASGTCNTEDMACCICEPYLF